MKYIKILLFFSLFLSLSSFTNYTDDSSPNISGMIAYAGNISSTEIRVRFEFDIHYRENASNTPHNVAVAVGGQTFFIGTHQSGDHILGVIDIPNSLVDNNGDIYVECKTNVTGQWRQDGCIVIVQPCFTC